ncbi:amino-acid N-acetyltransferase [Candidatus Planktophila lacus]|jgi:amino-acid N-acetyltransferase|uniref:amino-acid N-acetyltransferase n=1 Tax=Candidatus Planktophila lacus TaxID=1884913 RepID=UPI000BACBAD0|nr:amino-acid N-acetyltransferase [Candidatus Planktophila lacus]ASY29543.1 amino-acid N-acetyltransferase [Candidatus Planktophila lacus]
MVNIRPARTKDVKAIRQLVDSYAAPGQMLSKETVTLYESVQEFTVAEVDGKVIGCGALHVLWDDLAEVRTVAVDKDFHKKGIGHQLLENIIERARIVGVERIFCLTFQTEFFGRHGFVEIEGTPVAPDVYQELLRSYDAGVAEFLDLEAAKPNTLGNTRMLLTL